jgi:hypothetical protein
MTLAEDNNMNIYYQDTDSMHIEDDKVNILANLFKQIYKRELIGKNMGQFHCDFEVEGLKDIVAIDSIFLGKKAYIDKLEGTDIETSEKRIAYHARLKGIPNRLIENTAHKMNMNQYELFQSLYEGKSIEFDLLDKGGVLGFKRNNDRSITTIKEFKRIIKF